jgi:hypothetical protein
MSCMPGSDISRLTLPMEGVSMREGLAERIRHAE